MKKGINIVVVFFVCTLSLFAQQTNPTITFDETNHDFGQIKEEDGPVTCEFVFTNTGSVPLVIKNVVTSCGCTSPSWSKAPVVPGGKGFVKATYNPKNRPGKFAKTITVSSNANKPTTVLRISGDVIQKVKTIEEIYRYAIGSLRLKTNHIAFTEVFKGNKKTQLSEIINNSDQPIRITFKNIPAHISIKAIPALLPPGKKGIFEAVYDADKKNDWGFIVDRIEIMVNEKVENNNRLTISATIKEDFTNITQEDLLNAPIIQFQGKTFNFNKIGQREKAEHDFVFTNAGKSDLIIRKIKSSCGCTAVSPKEKVISPGASSSIKAIFSAGTSNGKQNKQITVITNDPKNSIVYLKVTGEVISK